MESVIRRHRGGIVLALGIVGMLSPFTLVPLGPIAWFLGGRDLRGMRDGRVDPAGRSMTQVGHVLGIVGTLLWLCIASVIALLALVGLRLGPITSHSSDADHPDVRQTQVSYQPEKSDDGVYHEVTEFDFREVQQPGGKWVKDGPFVHWSRTQVKLEEGSYKDGKREGAWSVWHEDGTPDAAKSGVYVDDARVPQ